MSTRLKDLYLELRRDQLGRLFERSKYKRPREKVEPYPMAA
jgi:hypothetical protein